MKAHRLPNSPICNLCLLVSGTYVILISVYHQGLLSREYNSCFLHSRHQWVKWGMRLGIYERKKKTSFKNRPQIPWPYRLCQNIRNSWREEFVFWKMNRAIFFLFRECPEAFLFFSLSLPLYLTLSAFLSLSLFLAFPPLSLSLSLFLSFSLYLSLSLPLSRFLLFSPSLPFSLSLSLSLFLTLSASFSLSLSLSRFLFFSPCLPLSLSLSLFLSLPFPEVSREPSIALFSQIKKKKNRLHWNCDGYNNAFIFQVLLVLRLNIDPKSFSVYFPPWTIVGSVF